MKAEAPVDVSAYIAAASPKARPMLRQLRRIIRTCAPQATERISYKIPYYDYHGRLIYFAAFSQHVSLYAWGRPIQLMAHELSSYRTSKSTLQFPIGTRIPVALVKRLVMARVQANEAKKKG